MLKNIQKEVLFVWETKTGYCPVHNSEVTIEVQYTPMRAIGAPVQKKAVGHKCAESLNSRTECSNCPIAYGPPRNAH